MTMCAGGCEGENRDSSAQGVAALAKRLDEPFLCLKAVAVGPRQGRQEPNELSLIGREKHHGKKRPPPAAGFETVPTGRPGFHRRLRPVRPGKEFLDLFQRHSEKRKSVPEKTWICSASVKVQFHWAASGTLESSGSSAKEKEQQARIPTEKKVEEKTCILHLPQKRLANS